jgi:hypothetical protein
MIFDMDISLSGGQWLSACQRLVKEQARLRQPDPIVIPNSLAVNGLRESRARSGPREIDLIEAVRYPIVVPFVVRLTWSRATADLSVGGQDGTSQKKLLPAAFLPPWPPQRTRRFGSGSGVTWSQIEAFWRSCGDFLHPWVYSVSAKGIARTEKTAGRKRLTL